MWGLISQKSATKNTSHRPKWARTRRGADLAPSSPASCVDAVCAAWSCQVFSTARSADDSYDSTDSVWSTKSTPFDVMCHDAELVRHHISANVYPAKYIPTSSSYQIPAFDEVYKRYLASLVRFCTDTSPNNHNRSLIAATVKRYTSTKHHTIHL